MTGFNIALVAVVPALAALAYQPYVLDPSWQPEFPVGTGTYSAVDVAGDKVFVGQRSINFSNPVLVFDRTGRFLNSFGAGEIGQGLHHEETEFGVHGVNLHVHPAAATGSRGADTLWVTDFMNHSVLAYSTDGDLLGITGGVASADDDKFDAPSDVAFRGQSCYFVDGDGGLNMRVSRWSLKHGLLGSPEWQVPTNRPEDRADQEFDHPHSVAWHETSDRIVVADRDHYRIVLMEPDTGAITSNVTCDLDLGPGVLGRPFGVRTWLGNGEDLLVVAVAGNDGVETGHQFMYVLDASGLGDGACAVLQSWEIDPTQCHTPHLLGLDQANSDIYVACNQQPNSNVLRFVRGSGGALV